MILWKLSLALLLCCCQSFQFQRYRARQYSLSLSSATEEDEAALIKDTLSLWQQLKEATGGSFSVNSQEDAELLAEKMEKIKQASRASSPSPLPFDRVKRSSKLLSKLLAVSEKGEENIVLLHLKDYVEEVRENDFQGNASVARAVLFNLCDRASAKSINDACDALTSVKLLTNSAQHAGHFLSFVASNPYSSPGASELVSATLQRDILTRLEILQREDLNQIVRQLSKRGYMMQAVDLVRAMHRSPHASPDSQTLEWLVKGFVLTAEPVRQCKTMKSLPNSEKKYPEILLLGRSNAGKSSLLNALLRRKSLASVSAMPGHTQSLQLYELRCRTGRLILVDSPGMGYAESVPDERRRSWKVLLQRYLAVRDNCKLVLHLMDYRASLTAIDEEIMDMVRLAEEERRRNGRSPFLYQPLLTKADHYSHPVTLKTVKERQAEISKLYPGAEAMVTSSQSARGLEEVWFNLIALVDKTRPQIHNNTDSKSEDNYSYIQSGVNGSEEPRKQAL